MSASRPLFITFHCGDPYYARRAAELQDRCAALGVPLEVAAAPDQGCYWRNTLYKPIFIRERLAALGRDLIWIDADTALHRDDAAFHALGADLTLATHSGDLAGIKASPIGVAWTPQAAAFVAAWADACQARLDAGEIDLDHDLLKYEVLPAFAGRLSLRLLGDPQRAREFTEGATLTNGLSGRGGGALAQVLRKNRIRGAAFAALRLEQFEVGRPAP